MYQSPLEHFFFTCILITETTVNCSPAQSTPESSTGENVMPHPGMSVWPCSVWWGWNCKPWEHGWQHLIWPVLQFFLRSRPLTLLSNHITHFLHLLLTPPSTLWHTHIHTTVFRPAHVGTVCFVKLSCDFVFCPEILQWALVSDLEREGER